MLTSGFQHEYVLWLMVMVYGLHILEEFTLDWKSWSHEALGFNLEWSNFYVTNAIVIVLGFSSAMIGWKLPGVSLMFPAVAIVNAIFLHIVPTIKARRYSPGLFTAVIGFLPIGALCYSYDLRDNGNNYGDIAISLIGGALLMAYPVVMIRISERRKTRVR
ncbi:MAG TPA: HXXEE domain-containing protein [Rectinemataceae bacterium]|nr:HXXEE domain-containing protein [Rectinemataceae bacterium]